MLTKLGRQRDFFVVPEWFNAPVGQTNKKKKKKKKKKEEEKKS